MLAGDIEVVDKACIVTVSDNTYLSESVFDDFIFIASRESMEAAKPDIT